MAEPAGTVPAGRTLPRDLPSLTSLRAGAALLVFGYHLRQFDVLHLPFVGSGDTGVAFFFVLSGFLLTWGYTGSGLRRFYVRRVARVFPSHLVTWAVALVVLAATVGIDWGPAVLNAFLLQAWVPTDRYAFSANAVAWSLSCEIAFYAVLPLVLVLVRRGSVRACWTVVIGLFLLVGVYDVLVSLPGTPAVLPLLGYVNPVLRLPQFLLGVAAATAVRAGWVIPWRTALAVCVTCAVGFGLFSERPARDFWLTPVYLVVILVAVRLEQRGGLRWLAHPALVYAGKVSFGFYLVQELVLVHLADAMGPGVTTAALAFALACIGAVALHHGVELPGQTALVRRLGAVRATPPSDPVSGARATVPAPRGPRPATDPATQPVR